MIEIIFCLIIWCWGLTPLWLNVLLTILLFLRFSWRVLLTMRRFLEFANKDNTQKAGDNSIQVQAGGDIYENTKTDTEV